MEPTLSENLPSQNQTGKGRIPSELDGVRLDKALPALFEGLSRTKARELIQRGAVRVNGRRLKVASRPVKTNDTVEWMDDPNIAKLSPQSLDVVEWGHGYVVVRKHPNQLVQGSPSGDKGSLERLLRTALQNKARDQRRRDGGDSRKRKAQPTLHVVHRLDAPAQGLVVFATQKEMAANLSRQLQERTLHRVYWALVEGQPPAWNGTIDLPLSKLDGGRVHVDASGREARTHWKTLRAFPSRNLSLLELTLETGRTHQIRAHLAEVVGPIVGDWRYGSKGWKGLRLAAVELSFKGLGKGVKRFRKEPSASFFAKNLLL